MSEFRYSLAGRQRCRVAVNRRSDFWREPPAERQLRGEDLYCARVPRDAAELEQAVQTPKREGTIQAQGNCPERTGGHCPDPG